MRPGFIREQGNTGANIPSREAARVERLCSPEGARCALAPDESATTTNMMNRSFPNESNSAAINLHSQTATGITSNIWPTSNRKIHATSFPQPYANAPFNHLQNYDEPPGTNVAGLLQHPSVVHRRRQHTPHHPVSSEIKIGGEVDEGDVKKEALRCIPVKWQ
jgi:hypothetical protein